MTINQFRQLAAYNRWANARLYSAALDTQLLRLKQQITRSEQFLRDDCFPLHLRI
jgi:uncharacterized damage-inducible protein DinB